MLKTWKKAVSLVLVFAMSMMVCVPAFAAEKKQSTQINGTTTTITECTQEDYFAAVAREKNISVDEVRSQYHVNKLPYSEKYYSIEQDKNIGQGYSLKCMATAHVLVDNGNFGHVCEVLDVAAPYVTINGKCSNVEWSGSIDPRTTSSEIRIIANGEVYFDVNNSVSLSGGEFVQVGSSTSTTTRYRYYAKDAEFIWGLTDI